MEILKKYPLSFSIVSDKVKKSDNPNLTELKQDSLFIIKVIYALLDVNNLWDVVENKDQINSLVDKAIQDALEDEINVKDVQYTLSNYIINRPRQNIDLL